MITKQLANQIVEQTMLRLHRNINVIQTNGMILASGDHLRVDSIHEGAVIVAETRKPLLISEENNHLFPKTKPGINLPIFFQQELVGVIGITGDPKEIEEIATLVQLTTEMMVYQALIASEREWKRKIQEMVFEELMSGQPLQKVIFERINKIGFQNKAPFHTMMIELNPESKSYHTILQAIEHYFNQESILVGHYQLNEHFILTSGLEEKVFQQKVAKLATILKKYNALPISIGQVVHSLDQVHHSYQTARIAFEYGQHQQSLIYFEEVELFSLFKKRDSQEVEKFTDRILGILDEKLLLTLHAYFKCNQQLAVCADSLAIHRHTLTYRLHKIHDQTGYNPTLFQEAIVLQIALWMKDGTFSKR